MWQCIKNWFSKLGFGNSGGLTAEDIELLHATNAVREIDPADELPTVKKRRGRKPAQVQ